MSIQAGCQGVTYTLAGRVAEVLIHDVSSSLVKVTRSSDQDFLQGFMSLRSISHDPEKWSQRGQEFMRRKQDDDVTLCFRRAKDKHGEICATAYISEEKGRRSIGEAEAARGYFWSAAQKFMELETIAAAVRSLKKIEGYKEAAWL